jgi:hypothetical protein
MLRVVGRKHVELETRIRNLTKREIDYSTLSVSTDAAEKCSNSARASINNTQTARSQRDFLKLGRRISACACDERA